MERTICNNNLLRFDPSKATKDQIRQWLFSLIDAEIDKEENKIDYDLIEQCTICEAYLAGDPMALSDEEYQKDLARIISKQKASQQRFISKKIVRKPRLSVKLRILAAAIALAVAMFSALTVFAKIKGYKSAWDLICQNMLFFIDLGDNQSISEEGIIVVKSSVEIKYASMEDFREKENWDILIPTVLSKNINLQRILVYDEIPEKKTLYFQFSSELFEFTVKNYYTEIDTNNSIIYKTKATDFYIYESIDGKYQAMGQVEGYEYTIRHTNYKELIKILDNMKGTE